MVDFPAYLHGVNLIELQPGKGFHKRYELEKQLQLIKHYLENI